MLRKVEIGNIRFPNLYLAENEIDIAQARKHGIPYIAWQGGLELFVKTLLRPTLEKMFPGILWDEVLGERKSIYSDVVITKPGEGLGDYELADYDADEMLEKQLAHRPGIDDDGGDEDGEYHREVDIAEEARECGGSRYIDDEFHEDRLSVYDYIGDLSSSVDIDALQQLKLLPKFIGDVADCIRANLSERIYWTEGYNKKLSAAVGTFTSRGQLPNLLIIDISSSIPDGIASTMIVLAETLREQCNAELIITSRRSGYYPLGAELPDPQTLRNYYGRSNEGSEFWSIIVKHIAGREFGHVISFGDNDWPGGPELYDIPESTLENTRVHEVHHYHTWCNDTETGYARWVREFAEPDKETFDTDWCQVMDKSGMRYRRW